MATSFSTIQVAAAGGVLTITLDRPDSLNALNEQMSTELSAALRSAERDKALRCVVITGSGRAFCSGQDLRVVHERLTASEDSRGVDFGTLLRQRYNPIISRIRTLEKPVIAAVNGVAAGAGASLAFACDLCICAKSAAFMMAFVRIGLVPDLGATLTLLRHVGHARAAELCFLGEKLPAEEALGCGLVNRVVDDGQFEAAVKDFAARLAKLPTRAIGLTKRALNRAWTATLDDQLEYEAFLQDTASKTADYREGIAAFIEKREPKYAGK
ncbi:MAG: enoyl-CoA hydratase/isomerase family protein [Planctomycetes bacterium]|nr:enoyl-CoA hydratase/isomerase family protein [Planctomycetota bacterium]